MLVQLTYPPWDCHVCCWTALTVLHWRLWGVPWRIFWRTWMSTCQGLQITILSVAYASMHSLPAVTVRQLHGCCAIEVKFLWFHSSSLIHRPPFNWKGKKGYETSTTCTINVSITSPCQSKIFSSIFCSIDRKVIFSPRWGLCTVILLFWGLVFY